MKGKTNLRSPNELRGALMTAGERVRKLRSDRRKDDLMPETRKKHSSHRVWDHTDDLLSLYERETKDLLSILD
jgi:hypothetical protein